MQWSERWFVECILFSRYTFFWFRLNFLNIVLEISLNFFYTISDIFWLIFIKKLWFCHFHFFFWQVYSFKFPQQNIRQSHTRIGENNLSVELFSIFFRKLITRKICYWKPYVFEVRILLIQTIFWKIFINYSFFSWIRISYIRRSEDVQDVFCTSYVRSIYVLCLRGISSQRNQVTNYILNH